MYVFNYQGRQVAKFLKLQAKNISVVLHAVGLFSSPLFA
jgi:hypothetical protein